MITTQTSRGDPPVMSAPATCWRRGAATVVAAIGPLAVAVIRALLPYHDTDTGTQIAAAVAAHQGAASAVLWLDLLAAITLIVGVMVVGVVAVRAAPALGTAGAVLAVAGFGSLFLGAVPPDAASLGAVQAGLDPATTGRVLDAMAEHPAAAVATAVFVAGHILGVVLLGAALWKGHAIPVWAALALIVSQPLHLIFAVVVPNSVLDAVAWVLTAIGFAAAGLALARGPRPRPGTRTG